jgi:c-di-GMP phosphodiesterase
MRTINTYYTYNSDLSDFIQQNDIQDSSKLLIQIFTFSTDYTFLINLTNFFKTNFPNASLIGSTTDGEIKDGHVSTKTTVISFTIFDNVRLKTYISDQFKNYFEAGHNLATNIIEDDTKVIISFIDGLSGNGEEYLQGINSVKSNIIVAGGLAGDSAKFKQTYIFTKDTILDKGVVGVSLSSENLNVFTDYSFNWLMVGKQLTITKVKENRVFMIDDKSAVDTYDYYLGKNISEKLPYIGIEFPLIIERNGLHIARAPIAKEDDGSLIFAGNFHHMDKVRFGYGDSDEILEQTQNHINKLYNIPIESIFIYSCMARRRFIPDEIENETIIYNQIAPTSGFYTYGEFFSSSDNKQLLNQSMTLLALSESDQPNTQNTIFNIKKNKSTTIQALSHLLSIATKELDNAQKDLQILASTDPMTKLYNRRSFNDISESIFKISKRNKSPLSIIMIDIDKFKNVNDTYGHKTGDSVIIKLAEFLNSSNRKSDIVCRYGGEEFVILLPQTGIEGSIIVAENIRKQVENIVVKSDKNQMLNFTISLGVSEVNFRQESNIESALNRADEALYIAKNNGRNQVAKIDI